MFHWRGKDFHGQVCEGCNALWDDPEESFHIHVGEPVKRQLEIYE